jgi:hypothetical protein
MTHRYRLHLTVGVTACLRVTEQTIDTYVNLVSERFISAGLEPALLALSRPRFNQLSYEMSHTTV